MARPSIDVDRARLMAAVKYCEDRETFKTRNDLNTAVAEQYKINTGGEITMSVVYLRLKEWADKNAEGHVAEPLTVDGYSLRTLKGRRGRTGMSDGQKEKMRLGRQEAKQSRGKFDVSKDVLKEAVAKMKEDVPQRFQRLVRQAATGSRAAAMRLFCLSCVGYVTADVRECDAKACPLWLYRPYQGKMDPSERQEFELGEESRPVIIEPMDV